MAISGDLQGLWKTFVRRSWPLRHVPFLDFVFGSGSMALGTADENSDFDVIIGAKQGRIFTVRFFSAAVLGVFGWRRKRLDHRVSAAKKICLNHFVTPRAYRLSPPYNDYWRALYGRLVPICGDIRHIDAFLHENSDWIDEERTHRGGFRHRYQKSWIANFFESILGGPLGDTLERLLKKYQVKRIERSFLGDVKMFKPRIRYTDDELEFHPIGWKELPKKFEREVS